MKRIFWTLVVIFIAAGARAETLKTEVYAPVELVFQGPRQGPRDTPARDIMLSVTFVDPKGSIGIRVFGFWDGNGAGGLEGGVFKVRFTPTSPGTWKIGAIESNVPELRRQHAGDTIEVKPGKRHGFWTQHNSPWYVRSDNTYQYIIGNTEYSFLSGYRPTAASRTTRNGVSDKLEPSGVDIAADVRKNAEYFKKLRFSLFPDRYPNPDEKPFLDDEGRPTDNGDFSHRPNPRWFALRADTAVATAFECDLIADLILAGPDTGDSRATLRAAKNGGDAGPWLRYVAARYGSYPNVWFCLCNEFNIKTPKYTEAQIAQFGQILNRNLPYRNPVSVHSSPPMVWSEAFDALPEWHDHQICQKKVKTIAAAADVLMQARGREKTRLKPAIDDELSYQGEGDRHTEGDTIEAHLGAFLGGGHGTTGYKPGNKLGHYFWGGFDPAEHTAADNLRWLRETIDANIRFQMMRPMDSSSGFFTNLDAGFRAMKGDSEYVLGTDRARAGLVANLPGYSVWRVVCHDVIAKKSTVLAEQAEGAYTFDAPGSRAVLFHFKRTVRGAR